MAWKEYELSIKCKKCKTHKKMVCARRDSGKLGFECMGCHNLYTHPVLELAFAAGEVHGRKVLQAELRNLLGAAYLHEAREATAKTE